jgi:hypothetical protein
MEILSEVFSIRFKYVKASTMKMKSFKIVLFVKFLFNFVQLKLESFPSACEEFLIINYRIQKHQKWNINFILLKKVCS